MKLPQKVPAMNLPETVLLPKTVLPLRIFEERYREMLADSLSGDRVFAIANLKPTTANPNGFHDVATVGLIRMSSQNPDGTSLLMLEGTERVKIDEICQTHPYPLLKISPLPTTNRPDDAFEAEIVVDLLDKIDALNVLLGPSNDDAARACHAIDDLEMLTHFIMQTYCTNADTLQNTLETTDLVRRCKLVSDFLHLQIVLINDTEE